MIEVLWHGRGGQGAFTAARLLGAAASMADGKYALAFPSFGPERRGAPMRAFTKMNDAPIGNRSAIAQADYVVYLDGTLFGEGWERELKPGGLVLVNSVRVFEDERVVALDADGISSAILGRPIPNTVFLGALSVLCDRVSVADVEKAICSYMPEKLHAKNLEVVRVAREAVARQGGGALGALGYAGRDEVSPAEFAADALSFAEVETRSVKVAVLPAKSAVVSPSEVATVSEQIAGASVSEEAVVIPAKGAATSPATGPATPQLSRPVSCTPVLRSTALKPAEFAHSTCFEGGYLTVKNAGWRNIRPVVDPGACTGCLQCYLYCPDGAVFKVHSACSPAEAASAANSSHTQPRGVVARSHSGGVLHVSTMPAISDTGETLTNPSQQSVPTPTQPTAPVAIDYDFCKGCGVCAKACKFNSITMIPESEAHAQ